MFKIRYIGDFKAVHYKWCKFHYFWLLQDLKLIIIWYISFVNSSKPNLLSLLDLTKKCLDCGWELQKSSLFPRFCYIHVSPKSVLVYILPFVTWRILFTLPSVISLLLEQEQYPSSFFTRAHLLSQLSSNSRGT